MRAFKSVVLLSLAAGVLPGCASNVVYFDIHPNHNADNTTRIFVDAFGSIYPREGLPHTSPTEIEDGSLFNHLSDGQSAACFEAIPNSQLSRLCGTGGSLSAWRDVQTQIWTEIAEDIVRESGAQTRDTDLVFLLHGFNNTFSEANPIFEVAKRDIRPRINAERSVHFVEIYWDGHSSSVGVGAWGKAQWSGPLAGFHMRPMFNALSEAMPGEGAEPNALRILTHSSGAFVLGATFGNPAAALPRLRSPETQYYDFFADNAAETSGNYRIPQFADLRIGVLAAATSSETFTGTSDYPGGFLARNTQVLLSINQFDEVLQKGGLGANFPGSGSTGLGTDREYYCERLRGNTDLATRGVEFVGYDFDRTGTSMAHLRDAHDFQIYIHQADAHSSFLDDLMGPGPVDRDAAEGDLCEGLLDGTAR